MFSCLYYWVIIWFFSFNLEWVAQKAEIEAARAILAFWQQHWLYFYNTEKAFIAFEKLICANWFQIELETVRLPIHNINMKKNAWRKCRKIFLEAIFSYSRKRFFEVYAQKFRHFTWHHWLRKFPFCLFAYLISQSILLFLTFQVFHGRISYEPCLSSLLKVWTGGGSSIDDQVIYDN